MTDKETLIEHWTRCLDDNAEEQIHAQTMLAENIDENAATLPTLVTLMQGITEKNRKMRRRVMWCLITVAIALSFIQLTLPLSMYSMQQSGNSLFTSKKDYSKIQTNNPADELLLYGDPGRNGKANQMQALWESDPSNPAYFADYSLHYISEHKKLPPDFLRTAAEIGPDNGWFTFIAAVVTAKDACKEGKLHLRSPINEADLAKLPYEEARRQKRKMIYHMDIIDPARSQESLDLWRKSLNQKKYESYEKSMYQSRYPLLQHRTSYITQYPPIIYMVGQPYVIEIRNFDELLVAHLQKSDMQSAEGQKLLIDIDAYLQKRIKTEPMTLLDAMMQNAAVGSLCRQINIIDTAFLELELVKKWQKRSFSWEEYDDNSYQTLRNSGVNNIVHRHGSELCHVLPQRGMYPTTIPLTIDQLSPLRYVDHAFYLRYTASVISVFLLLLIPFHLFVKRHKPLIKLSEEAWQCVPWKSQGYFVLWSVVVPLCYYILLVCFTPLTGKEFSVSVSGDIIFPVLPAISLVLLMILLPRLLVHRFAALWTQQLNTRARWQGRIGWICVLLCLIPLHTLPLFFGVINRYSQLQTIAIVCWVPGLLWLLWNGGKDVFTRHPIRRVIHGIRRRMIAVCTVCVIITLFLSGLALQLCERYWIKKDTLLDVSSDKIAGQYEAEVIKALHQDLLKIMSE